MYNSFVNTSIIYLFYVEECFACICICVPHSSLVPEERPEEDVGFPRTDITGGCELPCASWTLNPGPREEQAVLLTAEPSFQPYNSDEI